MRKVCVFVGSRANYSSIKSVMQAVKDHPKLELQVVLGASTLLDRFGRVADLIREDGFEPDMTFYNIVEGENPVTMAKSTGLGIIEMSTVLKNLSPDVVVIVGDRFEMMSVTIAAAYMNIPIAHTMGGEVTGTIDESIRHAITKFAHIHFPANEDAKERIIKMGEDPSTVHNLGCPRLDLVKDELLNNSEPILNELESSNLGVGSAQLDLSKPFLLVSQHPVTTEYGSGKDQIMETLNALENINMQTIMLWPNIDAGSDDISSGIRSFREKHNPSWLKIYKNLPTATYIHLMKNCACLIGNSSSGIREGAFIGTPVVNIGTRQKARERGENVIDVDYDTDSITSAIQSQLSHGRYTSLPTYGEGDTGRKIADILATVNVTIQKQITY